MCVTSSSVLASSHLPASSSVPAFFFIMTQGAHNAICEPVEFHDTLQSNSPTEPCFTVPHVALYWLDDRLEGRTASTLCLQREGAFVGVPCSWIMSMCLCRVVWSLLCQAPLGYYQPEPLMSFSLIKHSQVTQIVSNQPSKPSKRGGRPLVTHFYK